MNKSQGELLREAEMLARKIVHLETRVNRFRGNLNEGDALLSYVARRFLPSSRRRLWRLESQWGRWWKRYGDSLPSYVSSPEEFLAAVRYWVEAAKELYENAYVFLREPARSAVERNAEGLMLRHETHTLPENVLRVLSEMHDSFPSDAELEVRYPIRREFREWWKKRELDRILHENL